MVPWRKLSRGRHCGISRRRLHHRAPRLRHPLRWRHHLLAGHDARYQVLRSAWGQYAHLSIDDSNCTNDTGPNLGFLHSPDGRGGRRRRWFDHPAAHFADDYFRAACRAERCASGGCGPIQRDQQNRPRHTHAHGDRGVHRHHRHDVGLADLSPHERRKHLLVPKRLCRCVRRRLRISLCDRRGAHQRPGRAIKC